MRTHRERSTAVSFLSDNLRRRFRKLHYRKDGRGRIGSCRRELLEHIVVLSERRFIRLVRSYICYHEDRCDLVLFFTLNREDFSFVIHLDRQPRTSRRREAQTGSRARSGSRSERTLDAVEHSRTLMEWWPFLIFHRGGLRIKVINNTWGSTRIRRTRELPHLGHRQRRESWHCREWVDCTTGMNGARLPELTVRVGWACGDRLVRINNDQPQDPT